MTTDSDVYDVLQRHFGLGDWDADRSTTPWWKHRQLEASKIKRSRTSRNVSPDDLVLAAHYCKAHGHHIGAVTWLYKHIPAAIRWDNERSRAELRAELDDRIAAAVEEARDTAPEWVDRLVRARGPYREEVLAEWLQRSSRSRSGADRPASSA